MIGVPDTRQSTYNPHYVFYDMNLSSIKQILVILLFFILGFLIYSNTYESPFYFDGLKRIKNNPYLRLSELDFKNIKEASFNRHSSSRRPVANLSFAFNYYFHGYRLAGYHAVNIIVHILSGIFLHLFLKFTISISACCPEYERNPDAKVSWNLEKDQSSNYFSALAFSSALIWLVHPVHTQSITYIVQRMNSMAAMFFILSFYLYIRGRAIQVNRAAAAYKAESPEKRSLFFHKSHYVLFAGSVTAWIFALGSKQTAATLPFFCFSI